MRSSFNNRNLHLEEGYTIGIFTLAAGPFFFLLLVVLATGACVERIGVCVCVCVCDSSSVKNENKGGEKLKHCRFFMDNAKHGA